MLLLSANILEPKSLIRLLLFNFNNISEVFIVTLENFFIISINIFVHFTKLSMKFVHSYILLHIEGVLLLICCVGEFQ